MTVTLKDIANHLNISVATVSRVVNEKKCVSDKTRGKVLQAIEELHYKPNDVAISLRKKNTKVIGVIIPDITINFFSNVIKSIESAARRYGYSILLCISNERPEKEAEYLKLLYQKQISGLIISTVCDHSGNIQQYFNTGIPVVFIDNLPNIYTNFNSVTIDNEKAGYELTKHLIDMNHKNLAIITGPLQQTTGCYRLRGWKKAMREYDLKIRDGWIKESDFSIKSGYMLMNEILNENDIPTGLFTSNNLLAYGAVKALNRHNLRIPEEMAIVCFDGNDPTGLIKPQLTSMNQPAKDIGRVATEIIMRKLKHPDLKHYEKIILEPEISIKESCGYRKSYSL